MKQKRAGDRTVAGHPFRSQFRRSSLYATREKKPPSVESLKRRVDFLACGRGPTLAVRRSRAVRRCGRLAPGWFHFGRPHCGFQPESLARDHLGSRAVIWSGTIARSGELVQQMTSVVPAGSPNADPSGTVEGAQTRRGGLCNAACPEWALRGLCPGRGAPGPEIPRAPAAGAEHVHGQSRQPPLQ